MSRPNQTFNTDSLQWGICFANFTPHCKPLRRQAGSVLPVNLALASTMQKSHIYLAFLFVASAAVAAAEVALNMKGEVVSDRTQTLWGLIFLVGSIMWAVEDAKKSNFDKPFDFDFLMYIFWPVAFPYYLYATRGLEGLLVFLGFIGLWLGPWLAGVVAYVYLSTN